MIILANGTKVSTTDNILFLVPAKKCDGVCPRNYNPVCDNMGRTHGNGCLFNIAKCKNPKLKIVSNGRCKEGEEATFDVTRP